MESWFWDYTFEPIGQEVVVELKNDSEVRGVVEESDRGMNISMRNVRQVDANGTVAEFDFLVVNGPSIRYVHISPFLNVSSHITSHIRRLDHISKHTGPHKIVDRPKAAAAPISTWLGHNEVQSQLQHVHFLSNYSP